MEQEEEQFNYFTQDTFPQLFEIIPELGSSEDKTKALEEINKTILPFNLKEDAHIEEHLKAYFFEVIFLLEIYQTNDKNALQIIFKIAKSKDKQLVAGINRIFVEYAHNMIFPIQYIFPLVHLQIQNDIRLTEVNAQLDLKGFVFEKYRKKLKDLKKGDEGMLEIDVNQFAASFPKYNEKNSPFNRVCKFLLLKKKNKNKLFFYDLKLEKNQLDRSCIIDQNFIQVKLEKEHSSLLEAVLRMMYNCKLEEQQLKIMEQLHQLLNYYKILIPHALRVTVEGKSLIPWLLTECKSQSKTKYQFISFLLLRNNLLISASKQSFEYFSISDFSCEMAVRHLREHLIKGFQAKDISDGVLFACLYLLQVKRFSQYMNSPCGQKEPLNKWIVSIIPQLPPIQQVLLQQFAYIQNKTGLYEDLKHKYYFKKGEVGISPQFLYISSFFNTLEIKELFKEKQKIENQQQQQQQQNQPQQQSRQDIRSMLEEEASQQQEENDDEEMEFTNGIRFRFQNDENIFNSRSNGGDLVLLPIQKPKKKVTEKESQKQVIKQQKDLKQQKNQQKIELQEKQKKVQIEQELQQTKKSPQILFLKEKYQFFCELFGKELEIKADQPLLMPQQMKKVVKKQNNSNKITIEQVFNDFEIKLKKLYYFQRRMQELLKVVCPTLSWVAKSKSSVPPPSRDRASFEIGRRLFEGLGQGVDNERRNQMLFHIERLMAHRHRIREDEVSVPTSRINTNDIFQNIPEYVQPPKPKDPEPEKQIKQGVQLGQQKVQSGQIQEEKSEKVEEKVEEIVEEKVQEKVEEIVEEKVGEKDKQNAQEEKSEIIEEKVQEKQEKNIGQVIQQKVEGQKQKERQMKNEIQVEKKEQKMNEQGNKQQIDPQLPREQEEGQQIVEVMPVQPIIQRQILRVFNLPQTFLQDAGINIQFFDELPEDLQQQQIVQLMNQQRSSLNQQRNTDRNQMNDQVSQNVAFLDSLDAMTRASVLIEAAPQFLNNVPTHIRQEAQNLRMQQVHQMAEDQQMEEERNYMENKINPAQLVYPSITAKDFREIEQKDAQQIFSGLFIRVQGFRIQGIKFLLENKNTQAKTLTSFIILLRHLQELQHKKQKQSPITLREIIPGSQKQKSKIFYRTCWKEQDISYIRTYILHLIYEHFLCPTFKDDNFFKQKLPHSHYIPQLKCSQQYIHPLIQFLVFSLDHYPALSSQIITKAEDLPGSLQQKIVSLMKKDRLDKDFYKGLSCFSQNQKFKEIFFEQFKDEPPKIEILSKVLQYKFSHLPNLVKYHIHSLEKFCNNNHQFFNQIFNIYNLQELEKMESEFLKHKRVHFEVIKTLLLQGRQILKEPISILLKRPNLLDFQSKKIIFRNHPKIKKPTRNILLIQIDRMNIFQESYNQLMGRTLRQIEGRTQVSFRGEPGHDAGGIRRQWFLLVSRQIFNQDYALFEKSSSVSTYQPNSKSYINPDHLNYYKFIGRFIGKALAEKQLIDAYFTRAFYKQILGQELQFKDLQQQDFQFYKSMEWLTKNPIDEEMYTFSYIHDNFGKKETKQLMSGGEKVYVNEANKAEYIEKYCFSKMRDSFAKQMQVFLEGFHQIIPKQCISFFEAKELQLLMSGIPEIDFQDFKNNTDFSGYSPDDQVIVWFWQIVGQYDQQSLAKLVQFITGTSKIPVEGFSQLIGMNGVQKISIHKTCSVTQLPKSHTCFNQLDLPNYTSKQKLRQNLGICISWGSEGFGFM